MFQFQIHCIPVSWSAPIKGKSGFYDKKHKEKEMVRWQLKAQYNRDIPLKGLVALEFIFFLPIPKGASKAKRKQMLERRIFPMRPDTTNMQKLYEDCLQGIVIDNDCSCIDVHSKKFYSDNPGVTITVRTLEEQLNKDHEIARAIHAEKTQNHWVKV